MLVKRTPYSRQNDTKEKKLYKGKVVNVSSVNERHTRKKKGRNL